MKVAIVHDWLVTNAGAEKVLKQIVEIYPHTDIFTLVDFLNDEQREEILKGKKLQLLLFKIFHLQKHILETICLFFQRLLRVWI